MTIRKKRKNHTRRTTTRSSHPSRTVKLQFAEHVHELRRRLYYVIGSIIFWGCAVYAVEHHVVDILLKPAGGQHFIYTSPGGGIDFLFRICLYGGIVFSLPLIVYNLLRFIEPLITKASRRFILLGSFASGVLAVAGMVFGYFVGLPAALHFLLNQFRTDQIQPLVTIQSYLGFVIVYMVGSALLFQLPLLLILINRIKPLQPRRLLHYERWVILVAFILAAIINPSPNVFSLLLLAGPFILTYQIGIVIIAFINRKRKPNPVDLLHQKDAEAQAARHSRAVGLQPLDIDIPPASKTSRPAAARPAARLTRAARRPSY
ncbi:MAG: twin-arginine translocase subunit TatC [Candidatus Binatota bacterium]|nr:twin-arginine translocase subunit TatC [Candidatus Binatota bacterium]